MNRLLLIVLPFLISDRCPAEAPYAARTFGPLSGKRQLQQDGQHLYCLTKAGQLRIFSKAALRAGMKEIKPPPKPVGALKLNGVPETLEWTGPKTLCIGTGNHLALVDVSQPANPKLITEHQIAKREIEGASEVRAKGKFLYVAARIQGLLRFDISDPKRLVPAGAIKLRGFSYGVDLKDGTAAVATGIGIAFVDVSGKELVLKSTFDTVRNTEMVRYSGSHLISCSKHYTTVWSLKDPGQPEELSEVSTMDPFYFTHLCAMHVTRDHIFVGGGEGGLYLYDWRAPKSPRLIVQYSFWGTKKRLTPEKKMGYVKALGLARNDKEARKFITERENNYIIGMGMAVDGAYVYFVDWHDKLWGLEVELSPSPTARCVVRPE